MPDENMITPSSGSDKLDSALGQIKNWWGLILSITTGFVWVIVAFGVKEPQAKAIALVLAASAVGACIFFLRKGNEREALRRRRKDALDHWKERKPDAAFRGLLSYGEQDMLPGENRRREALAIATQVVHPDFHFGVLSGDVGCGKTSLLQSGLHELLEKQGYQVNFVRSPRQFLEESPSAATKTLPDKLKQALSAIRQKCGAASADNPIVLIIDQFEEFLIEFPELEQRQEIGSFLRQPMEDQHIRVLCAVRYDYILDMHDLAPALPEPLSTKALFRLRNFTETEAANVITECAQKDDLVLGKEFAELLASDLSQGGIVRPPELQLVCTALRGNITLDHYREAGEAKGILSDYTKGAIEICSRPDTGRLALRALCDFEASPPAKNRPQTEEELGTALGLSLADRAISNQLSRVLQQFEEAGLIISYRRNDEIVYSLIHDYLVGPVSMATSDVATRTEEADQLLKFYLGGLESDRTTKIPFRKLRFITTNSSPGLLRSARTKRLIKSSRIAHAVALSSVAGVIVLGTGVLYAATNTHVTWNRAIICRYYPPKIEETDADVGYTVSPDGKSIWGETASYISIWDTRSANKIFSDEAIGSQISPHGEFVLLAHKGKRTLEVIQVATKQRFTTPFTFSESDYPYIDNVTFGASEKTLLSCQDQTPGQRNSKTPVLTQLRVWSILDKRELGSVSGVKFRNENGGSRFSFYLTKSEDRLLMTCVHGRKYVPALWKVRPHSSANQIVYLLKNPRSASNFIGSFGFFDSSRLISVSEKANIVATVEGNSTKKRLIHLWDLRTGEHIHSQEVSCLNGAEHINLSFTSDGQYLFVRGDHNESGRTKRDENSGTYVLATSDLRPVTQVSPRGGLIIYSTSGEPSDDLVWADENNDAFHWNPQQTQPNIIHNFHLKTVDQIIMERDGQNVIISREGRGLELWNIVSGKKIREIELKAGMHLGGLTMDGRAIFVVTEGSVLNFYNATTFERINTLTDVGEANPSVFYDPDCQREQFWTNQGLVLRYTHGIHIPLLGFRQSSACPNS